MVPDVVFRRGDVKIAADEHFSCCSFGFAAGKIGVQFFNKSQLAGKGRVGGRIGQVAAGGNVNIVDFDSFFRYRADVTGIGFSRPVETADAGQRTAGKNGHAVVAGHAVKGDMFKTGRFDGGKRKVFFFGMLYKAMCG